MEHNSYFLEKEMERSKERIEQFIKNSSQTRTTESALRKILNRLRGVNRNHSSGQTKPWEK